MSESVRWKATGTIPEIYDSVFVPTVMRVWASQLVDLAAPQPGMRILDIACGTGIVTHQFAERISNQGQIVGYDISPEMLAVAQAKQSDTIIDWRLGDASHLPFEDQAFDIVTCQFGFMFFENRVANLQEMYRVLAPRGQLMILVWGAIERNPGFRAVAEGFERHVSAEAGNSIRGSFVMGDSQQMRDVVTAAGIQEARVQEVAAQAHFPSVELPVHGYGALLQAVIDEATHSRLIADVTAALQSYISQDGLVYPMAANLLYVRK